ncbi:hypothetical protein J2TS4_28580 [Paenibacillus sp. J2TS4]|nr:hypothetical protein J2TS4_28580 [Paenibacillus sp. J2TS4]
MCVIAKGIALANQKGGVGKKVLLVDADAQGNLTDSLGFHEPDSLSVSLATMLTKAMLEEPYDAQEGILHHHEGIDFDAWKHRIIGGRSGARQYDEQGNDYAFVHRFRESRLRLYPDRLYAELGHDDDQRIGSGG